jgi:hypothetical protein
MKFSVLTSVVIIALPPFALAVATSSTTSGTASVAFDSVYDNPSISLNAAACSDGKNGLESRGFTTFGSLPKFPNIGSSFAVAGWNSANCGTCWSLTYEKQTINMTAMDSTNNGFVLSKEAMDKLTGGQAEQLGRVHAQFNQVAASVCGLP